MTQLHSRVRLLGGVSALLLTASLATACGGGTGSSATDLTADQKAALADFKAKISKTVHDAAVKQTQPAPTEGPAGAKGRSIVIIPPAGASTEGGYRVALAAKDAAKALGWKVTFINPEGDPAKMNAAVQQAIAIKADAIAIVSIDASVVQSSLEQAKAAGIKVVASVAANTKGETGVFDSLVPSLQSGRDDGYALAAQAYTMNGGHLRDVQMMDSEFGYVVARQDGWKKFIKDCQAAHGDCSTVATTNFLAADITTKLPELTAQTLRSHSDFNVLWNGFDSGLTFSIQGAKQAGLAKKGTIAVGFDGNTPNLDDIRKDGYQKATIGLSTLAVGYGMIDNANRLLQGRPALSGTDQGIKNKLLTSDNVPASGPWWGDQDVRSQYWKVWGVKPAAPAAADTL
ncbi:substrate-binding domain-containing protein [Streptomyces sp. NPDC047000]|uniref:sugar ABC transporter substrate-binding protein n=1 Tax=Streptomyces sp. NPDC047000 TaxID=3155474 RepID=UPI0033FAE1A2